MLPRMLAALDILQLPGPALADLLQSAEGENEVLRRRTRVRTSRQGANDPDRHAAAPSLADHLLQQLALCTAPARVQELLNIIIHSLDTAGYRNITDDELAASIEPPATHEEMQECDAQLAKLDPPGAGARGVFEAILTRLAPADADRPWIIQILQKHMLDLSRHKHESVARDLGVSIEVLHSLLIKIRKLSSRPANGFRCGDAASVRPEITIEPGSDGAIVKMNDASLRPFVISEEALRSARDRTLSTEERAHWRERIEAARGLLANLEQRRATLERVARAIFDRQSAFLQKGPSCLRPLRMQDLADSLSVHASTISRAVAGKYVETPWGIFKLRDFFVSGVDLATGATATRDDLRAAIQRAFAEEDPARPLDDDAVVSLLAAKGFRVARRTIAKYRSDLGIPSSWHRRGKGAVPAAAAAHALAD